VKRERITWILLGLLIIYFFVEFNSTQSITVANKLVKDKIGDSIVINYSLLVTAILLAILIATMKYFQICLYIEKQYHYIHSIEEKLNTISADALITREGYSYLKEYPLLPALIYRIYNLFLPLGIIISMHIKVYFLCISQASMVKWLNIAIGITIITITWLYLLFAYSYVERVNSTNEVIKKIFIFLHLYDKEEE